MHEIEPRTNWSDETYLLAALHDLIGDLFAEEYEHIKRPGETPRFSTARQVDEGELDKLLARFRTEGGANG